MHLESSMLSPIEFARAVVPSGTTTVIADPHEIANVCGLKGIKYILDSTEDLPLSVYVMLPSCVPSSHLENAGATLLADDLAKFIDHPRVLGLGEMMNYPGVLFGDKTVLDKLMIAKDKKVDGHAPGLMGNDIMAYAAAGVKSDHECVNPEEAMDRLRAGMYLMIREGSAAHNLLQLLPVVNRFTSQFCFFATDDRHPADLIGTGHINNMVRLAVEAGYEIPVVLQMATINAATYFGLGDVLSLIHIFGEESFIARGKTVQSLGWKEIYQRSLDEDSDSEVREQKLPQIKEGDGLSVGKIELTQGKTKPPAPFTEASLLAAMENPIQYMEESNQALKQTLNEAGGLGTVATRADIIEKLFASFLLEKRGKDIFITAKGRQLLNLVPSELKSPVLTAKWEQKLSSIANGALGLSLIHI